MKQDNEVDPGSFWTGVAFTFIVWAFWTGAHYVFNHLSIAWT